jgi:hypothetical protein
MRGDCVMQIGSLRNYKIVLHYSLVHPGKSNIENIRLANKEFASIPPSKSIRTDVDKNDEIRIEPLPTKQDSMIRNMEVELLNIKAKSENISHKNKPSLLDSLILYRAGKYIDLYA